MQRIRKFIVTPNLPPKLQPLLEIARNMWWVWNTEAINLLRRVDPDLWEERHHNPVAVLGSLSADRISDLTRDLAFLAHLDAVHADLQRYLTQTSWFESEHEHLPGATVAYFSFEFGLHESLPLYSGGLGILAGDHLKSATDLGVPLVGVGLAYQYGYFRQYRLPGQRLLQHVHDPGAGRRWSAGDHRNRVSGAQGRRANLAGAGGPQSLVPAGHQPPREPSRRP